MFSYILEYIIEGKWFQPDTLYSVLSESNIPTIPGGYEGPPILQIVGNSNNTGTSEYITC